ncbi:geranyltranstransferase [Legionella waltersii]|uniref:Geranyltranstransferase n=1 Tax=Legionella waltersii TaxID=66969 RepID=A0A0W0ZZU3_9GAMM|nr:geranyltranstransferase [Legionella waltersii]SNV08901.1 geranyltranstransferase [Legionella waltersii]
MNFILNEQLPSESTHPTKLHQAMRYSVLNGGKRLRPAFIFAIGNQLHADDQILSMVSAAIEMIHTYSLIHDDLPAIDNDYLRRGVPTCHVAYGEATAILAGDALHTLAFEIISSLDSVHPDNVLKMIRVLARSIGSRGLIGGEELDIEMVNQRVTVNEVESMYQMKTSALLTACIQLAVYAANCNDEHVLVNLTKYGQSIGLSFQIHDDIIGIETDTSILGKTQNKDIDMNKPIYPVLVGMRRAKERRDQLYEEAIEFLKKAGCFNPCLEGLSRYIINRDF